METGKFSFHALKHALEEALNTSLGVRVLEALRLAVDGHAGQFRTTRSNQHPLPFIVHPVGTAKNAISFFPDVKNINDDLETIICVALAHDLLEDTRISGEQIGKICGERVRNYVEALTKPFFVSGESAEQRNKAFLDQIKRSGPTAIFIKACDSMHNLAYPSITPLDLFAKAAQKARRQYLPLVEEASLGPEFAAEFARRIKTAEDELVRLRRYASVTTHCTTLDEAIQKIVLAVKGKTLELHDILAVLRQITGLDSIEMWTVRDLHKGLISSTSRDPNDNELIQLSDIQILETSQCYEGENAKELSKTLYGLAVSKLVTTPLHLDPKHVFIITIPFENGLQLPWLDKNAATVLVGFLSHRLVLIEAERKGQLAREAAALGIQVDLELASRIGMHAADLAAFKAWLSRCDQARATVVHRLEEILMQLGLVSDKGAFVTIESRIKSVDSILKKMDLLKISWPHYNRIEDVSGVRIVCLSQPIVERIESAFLKDRNDIKLANAGLDSKRDFVKSPTVAGYRAIHLILQVETCLDAGGMRTVLTELQLRTLFQDAWAKVSHATRYKGTASKSQIENLKEMGRALEECDKLNRDLMFRAE